MSQTRRAGEPTSPAPSGADVDAGPRSGRRRDPSLDQAIFAATLALFTEEGYSGVTMEGVAARAGVAKATVYRRYPTKAHLLVEAVRVGACFTDHLPDTGDVRADLVAMLTMLMELLRGDQGPVMLVFAAERARNPALDEEFTRSVIGAKRAHLRYLVHSAIERGELSADVDTEIVAEAGPAILWHMALNHLPLTDGLPRRIVNSLIQPPVATQLKADQNP